MHFFSSDGHQIAFIDSLPAGSDRGEPIILIHGFASSHFVNWVGPQWVKTLTEDGRRVIALDNRGHGESAKLYDPALYHCAAMAQDAARLMAHLRIPRYDVMGYSMGARIGTYLALAEPARVRSLVMGGLGSHLVEGVGLPLGIADAMEVESLAYLTDPTQRMFRAFADANKADKAALAACIRGSRQVFTPQELTALLQPVLICIGTKDDVSGDARTLAALLPDAEVCDIPNRDHNRAVGDRVYREAVLAFLAKLG